MCHNVREIALTDLEAATEDEPSEEPESELERAAPPADD